MWLVCTREGQQHKPPNYAPISEWKSNIVHMRQLHLATLLPVSIVAQDNYDHWTMIDGPWFLEIKIGDKDVWVVSEWQQTYRSNLHEVNTSIVWRGELGAAILFSTPQVNTVKKMARIPIALYRSSLFLYRHCYQHSLLVPSLFHFFSFWRALSA